MMYSTKVIKNVPHTEEMHVDTKKHEKKHEKKYEKQDNMMRNIILGLLIVGLFALVIYLIMSNDSSDSDVSSMSALGTTPGKISGLTDVRSYAKDAILPPPYMGINK